MPVDLDPVKAKRLATSRAWKKAHPEYMREAHRRSYQKLKANHQAKAVRWREANPGVYRTRMSWKGMKRRCLNPNAPGYEYYGGRGITVCERWLTFDNFLADMGIRPEGLSLDRIDNNGNYEPGNCRWATRSEQQRNKRPFKRGPK
jgi:hypothetical protein